MPKQKIKNKKLIFCYFSSVLLGKKHENRVFLSVICFVKKVSGFIFEIPGVPMGSRRHGRR
jgi:hypothetical protein